MFKNVASQKVIVYAFDSTTNLPKTGDAANITAYVSKDYGSVTVLGDTSATEMDATNAKGYYLFDLTQSETNADTLLFSAKSSTANIVVLAMPATVFTRPANFSTFSVDSNGRVDVIKVAGTTQTARDIGASVLLSVGTGTGQVNLSSGKAPATLASTDVTGNVACDLQTIKTQTVTCSGGVTVPAATLASTTNITSATGIDVTKWAGTTLATPDTAGYPKVTIKSGTGTGEVNLASGVADANVTKFGGSAGTFASGRPEVNTTHFGGTAGTFPNAGFPAVDTRYINSDPVNVNSAQVGVNVVGAGGISWTAGAIGASTLAADCITAAKIAADAIGASELAADAASEIATAVATALGTGTGLTTLATAAQVSALSIPTTAQIADKFLGRNIGGGSDGTRTVTEALQLLRNRWTRDSTLTVYAQDDTTVSWTSVLTTASLNPVSESNP